NILPYYFYMCDMIPGSEHWRMSLAQAQALQHQIMGYLPGFATPRIVCDVPYVGKRWVHQVSRYDTELGISYWTKNYRTAVEADDPPRRGWGPRPARPAPRVPLPRPAPPPARRGPGVVAGPGARPGRRRSRRGGRPHPGCAVTSSAATGTSTAAASGRTAAAAN